MGKLTDAQAKANLARKIADAGRDKFLSDLDGIGKILNKEIKNAILEQLDVKGGKIDRASSSNKKLMKEISAKLLTLIEKAGYGKAVKSLLDNFDDLTKNTAQAASIANNLKVAESLLTSTQQLRRDQAIAQLLGDGLSVNVVQPINQILTNQIVLGGNLQDLISEVEQVLVTNANSAKPALGLLESYATRIGRDTLFQMQGAVNQAIQQEYNLDAVLYVGTEVDDTRPQCQRWLDREIILIKDLQDEIDWAYNNGKGMIEGTTPSTFAIERGGYNCRHAVIPINSEVYNQSK